jgi:hypothetical protein
MHSPGAALMLRDPADAFLHYIQPLVHPDFLATLRPLRSDMEINREEPSGLKITLLFTP